MSRPAAQNESGLSERRPLGSEKLPDWETADLPEPPVFTWRHWTRLIGPGIVMMGIQIGGGEWLFGPEITARFGGGLLWIATLAIALQVFYNLECGRYAIYCGEPILTGFLRMPPAPRFWVGVILLLNLGALIPGLSTHGAAVLASLLLDRPPGEADRWLVVLLAYLCLVGVTLPVLVGGKVYNVLKAVMTIKVFFVLGFCLLVGVLFVRPENWWRIARGFFAFGNVPTLDSAGAPSTANLLREWWQNGSLPTIALADIAVLGAFAGYAGGGGLANSTYSNFVRDQGWGMGAKVGAIPSAIGGRQVELSHVGKVFPLSTDNRRRFAGWWRQVLVDQLIVWAPGCFMGMALPALLSIEFAPHSALSAPTERREWTIAVVTPDGLRHCPRFPEPLAKTLWVGALLAGMLVLLPSQMSIVDDFSRRWTDAIWTANRRVRESLHAGQVKWIYYSIFGTYAGWSVVCAYLFSTYGTPKLMTVVIANLNNLAIGVTSFMLLWTNHSLLPAELRPRWYHRIGVAGCGGFYLALTALVVIEKIWSSGR